MEFVFSPHPFDDILDFNARANDKICGFISWSFNERRDFCSDQLSKFQIYFPRQINVIHIFSAIDWWDSRFFFFYCDLLMKFEFFSLPIAEIRVSLSRLFDENICFTSCLIDEICGFKSRAIDKNLGFTSRANDEIWRTFPWQFSRSSRQTGEILDLISWPIDQ